MSTHFAQEASRIFEQFASKLARLDLRRAVALPLLLCGAMVSPAHAYEPQQTIAATASTASETLDSMNLAGMSEKDLDRWAETFALERGNRYWRGAQSSRVPITDPAFLRTVAIMNKLRAGGCVEGVEVSVFDNTDVPWKAMGLEGNRIVIQKSFVDSSSDNALAFALTHEAMRVQDHRVAVRYKQLLEVARDHARVNSASEAIGSYGDLESSYAASIVKQSKETELELDSEALLAVSKAGFDGLAGGKESLSRLVERNPNAPSRELRIKALEAEWDRQSSPDRRMKNRM